MEKRGVKFIVFSLLLLGGIYLLNDPTVTKVFFKPDDGIKKVFSRNAIERKADALAESGHLDEALELYQEAIQPQYINQRHEKSTAIGAMQDIYMWKGDYEKALEMISWFIDVPGRDPAPSALEKKHEIEALKNYQETGNPQMVLKHIERIRTDHKDQLPPGRGIQSETFISVLVRLYNVIGDHDSGIEFVNTNLTGLFERHPELEHVPTSEIAMDYSQRGNTPEDRKNRRGYEVIAEYLRIREGFERDKAEGFKGCAHSKPGEVCMGHATKALIESDYFPW